MKYPLLIILIGTIFLGIGCDQPVVLEQPAAHRASWQQIGQDVARYHFVYEKNDPYAQVILYRMDPKTVDIQTVHDSAKTLSAWALTYEDATLLTNGFYFHEDDSPSGWMQINYERIGERQFDRERSGLVTFDPVSLIDTSHSHPPIESFSTSAQSYPFLLKNGNPVIESDSGQLARRTFIGTDNQGHVYLGIIPTSSISLFELGRLLKDLPVEWESVLNLDGGPSTGLISSADSFNSLSPVPSVILVQPKTSL